MHHVPFTHTSNGIALHGIEKRRDKRGMHVRLEAPCRLFHAKVFVPSFSLRNGFDLTGADGDAERARLLERCHRAADFYVRNSAHLLSALDADPLADAELSRVMGNGLRALHGKEPGLLAQAWDHPDRFEREVAYLDSTTDLPLLVRCAVPLYQRHQEWQVLLLLYRARRGELEGPGSLR